MKRNRVVILVESAAMIALATVLSLVTIVNMPFGGSITACSMLPIILFAYRRKTKWGIVAAFVYALLQMFLGFSNVRYGTSFAAVCAIIFLDYIFAFAVLGLVGMFRDKLNDQTREIMLGSVLVCIVRYICHVISGCTVWAGVSIPEMDGLIYSLAYNAAYMIPETIVTLAGAWYISRMIDFRWEKLTINHKKENKVSFILNGVGILAIVGSIVFDVIYLFGKLQTEEGFDWTVLKTINPLLMIFVTLAAIVIWTILHLIANKSKNKV